MNTTFVTMIGNLSQSLQSVQQLIYGCGYLMGILLCIKAIGKLRQIGDARATSGSHERMFVPIAYFLAGSTLIFLPSAISVLSNTAFGANNILKYSEFNQYNIYDAMKVVIQTAGILWFVRGTILLVHSSEPGVKDGPKGLAFLVAGILAMNFEGTTSFLTFAINYLTHLAPRIINAIG